jgi:hypothetical protein
MAYAIARESLNSKRRIIVAVYLWVFFRLPFMLASGSLQNKSRISLLDGSNSRADVSFCHLWQKDETMLKTKLVANR